MYLIPPLLLKYSPGGRGELLCSDIYGHVSIPLHGLRFCILSRKVGIQSFLFGLDATGMVYFIMSTVTRAYIIYMYVL